MLIGLQAAWADDTLPFVPERPDNPICEPIDDEVLFANALLFGIEPIASAGPLLKLIEHRPPHFVSLMGAISLAGETRQLGDFSFHAITAPTKINGAGLRDLVVEMTTRLDQESSTAAQADWDWFWTKFVETHTAIGVDMDSEDSYTWACLRAEQANAKRIEGWLGYGDEVCGLLERVTSLEEARAMPSLTSELIFFSLERIEGAEARIGFTELHAPLYALDSIKFEPTSNSANQ